MNKNEIGLEKENYIYYFDHIFDPNSDQNYIFKQVGKQLIDKILEGYNSTLFAYVKFCDYTIFEDKPVQENLIL